jgi:glyoxylase-like metal-dependent hydrolase (beta-lactamase superfamily II)
MSGFRDRLAGGVLAVGLIALAAAPASASDITSQEIRGGLWLFQGAGSNVLALADGDQLLVVDGGLDAESADLLAAIKAATGAEKIATLIDTHWHPDVVGLNDEAAADGATIVAHQVSLEYLSHATTSPLFEGRIAPLAEAARPNQPTRSGGELTFAGQRVVYGYLPAAHTNGDLYVFFPDLDVIAAGGAVGSDSWPVLDHWNGAFFGGQLQAYESLSDLSTDETVVIPAQGPALTGEQLVEDRDMFRQLFRDMNYLMNKGMGYNDVVALNPLEGHEAGRGDPSRFLDAAYRSLEMAYVPD